MNTIVVVPDDIRHHYPTRVQILESIIILHSRRTQITLCSGYSAQRRMCALCYLIGFVEIHQVSTHSLFCFYFSSSCVWLRWCASYWTHWPILVVHSRQSSSPPVLTPSEGKACLVLCHPLPRPERTGRPGALCNNVGVSHLLERSCVLLLEHWPSEVLSNFQRLNHPWLAGG